jgi:Ni/Co efflux regulator RcnB
MQIRRFNSLALAVVLSLAFVSAPGMANPGNGNGNGNHGNAEHGNKQKNDHGNQGKAGKKNVSDDVSVRLSYDRARSLAVNYGLTGYSSLPPGIAKNLARGKPLPPGIAKKMVPASMLGQLPSYPGYEWRIAGDDLVLIALSTAIVTAVINGVFE